MKRLSLAACLLLSLSQPVFALDVGEISSFMHSDSARLSKEIKNTTDSGRLVNIKIERISSPLESGTVLPMGSKDEMLLSPASLILPANASDVIRFYYKGPSDNQERYYRIVWFDQALSDVGKTRLNATRLPPHRHVSAPFWWWRHGRTNSTISLPTARSKTPATPPLRWWPTVIAATRKRGVTARKTISSCQARLELSARWTSATRRVALRCGMATSLSR